MELKDVKNEEFRTKGFMVARGILSPDEIKELRDKVDSVGRNLEQYNENNKAERSGLEKEYEDQTDGTGVSTLEFSNKKSGDASGDKPTFQQVIEKGLEDHPEIRLTENHARRGDQVYPFRKRDVDPDARLAATTNDPFTSFTGNIDHLCDQDDYFKSIAKHPNIVSVLNDILAPNIKMFFDHIFNKAPYNDDGLFRGANRFHQDGFFHLDRRSVTCWLSLDGLTLENGPFHYVPMTEKYGQFRFDGVASAVRGESTDVSILEHTEIVTLEPGDAVFHDRWTLHGTAPNESPERRRGWSLHYADAESYYGDFENDPEGPPYTYFLTPDNLHFRDGVLHGNRDWFVVSGNGFPGRA